MIETFKSQATEDLFHGRQSKKASGLLPEALHQRARLKLHQIHAATDIRDLMVPPSNRLEKKIGNLKDFWSLRINDPYRVIFKWQAGKATEVEITDYH